MTCIYKMSLSVRFAICSLFFWSASLMSAGVCAQGLEQKIREVIGDYQAEVGVAVIVNGTDTVVVNNDVRYPLMSVVKFHQALAVAGWMQCRGTSLDSLIFISPEQLKPNTYSPLSDRYPSGNVRLSIRELLRYTLQQSDNNACDILFEMLGGTSAVDRYIRALGINDFSVSQTEDDMHRDVQASYLNWSSPLEAARLLEVFLTTDWPGCLHRSFIKQTMMECNTGRDRLPAPLQGTEAVIGHKTGSGDVNAEGLLIATNDIGFVYLPDGRRYVVAVFVKDSAADDRSNAQLIARISEAVYRYVAVD